MDLQADNEAALHSSRYKLSTIGPIDKQARLHEASVEWHIFDAV